MHPTSVFHWSDRAEMLSFVRARSFATLVDESLRVAQVPFIVDEREERLLCHFARSNPMVRSLPTRVVAVVNGADAESEGRRQAYNRLRRPSSLSRNLAAIPSA
jgi:transcriptional regulator